VTLYRTIVADPPWDIGDMPAFYGYEGPRRPEHRAGTGRIALGYETMSVKQITALPVKELSKCDAHLYLWTVNRFVPDAYEIARAWGFTPSTLLVWAKAPRGLGPGGAYAITTEFVLFCRRGSLPPLQRADSTWWQFKRPYENGHIVGSRKPDGFLDVVEQVSPGPYLEMFARRNRLGWDTWGNEALEHVDIDRRAASPEDIVKA
jgi:N6-adenosine-specific RNA methylase IME4